MEKDWEKGAFAYMVELYRWNNKINLTGVKETDATDVLIKPSVEMLDFIPEKCRVFDVGSGGGIPGIILAINRPNAEFLLVDSDQRKCSFLSHVSGMLKLSNVRVVRGRVEKLCKQADYAGTGDVVVSRAVVREEVFACSAGFLKPGGLVILHHSSKPFEPDARFEPLPGNEFADPFRFILPL
ncbi:MAG: 16S rRNA (guanine(527)-N(7))-methyltransferase RsmG [Nitrospinae bacterium]|nr:16S rRNA (guanine(527)-N(7))-methyltransferase RsmG [Nitrospinota bacterium]